MSTQSGKAVRTPREQLEALGHQPPHGWKDDSPRWHLRAAEDALDQGRLEIARAAVQRARESASPDSTDAEESAFVALRAAIASVDLRAATEEVQALRACHDDGDPVWNRRVRAIIAQAPAVFGASMRAGLLGLLPPVPEAVEAVSERIDSDPVPDVLLPVSGLPQLPEEDDFDSAAAVNDAPVAPMFSGIAPHPPSPIELEQSVAWVDPGEPPHEDRAQFTGRVRVGEGDADLTDAEALRERLVEEMLAGVSEEEGQLLIDVATTFLNNREFGSAELLFSAAMGIPTLRVPACEGLVQAQVGGGRHEDAAGTVARALRIYAREGDALLGIVYWGGIAALELGDHEMARRAFERISRSRHAADFPDLEERFAAVAA